MSTANLSSMPYFTLLDTNGVPVSGGKINTYAAGTSTPKTTYTDYNSNIAQTNPIVCDSAGRCEIWLGTGLYKFVITDASDNLIYTIDNVGTGGPSGETSLVVQTVVGSSNSLKALDANAATSVVALGYRTISDNGGGTFRWSASATGGDDGVTVDGNTTYTSGRWVRVFLGDINPRWYGAYGTGTDNDKSYFDKAIWYARSQSIGIHLTKGTYLLSSDTTFTGVPIIFDESAKFSWTNISQDMTAVILPGDITQHWSVGTVSSTYVPKLAGGSSVKPEHFGAVKNGTTDDFMPITQAIAAVSTYGGEVVLNDGTYGIGFPVNVPSNVKVTGVTEQGSVLKMIAGYSGANGGMLNAINTANNVVIDGVTLKGRVGINGYGIYGAFANTEIKNCKIEDIKTGGIYLNGSVTDSTNIKITNNTINDMVTAGIIVESGASITIEDNDINNSSGAQKQGIAVTAANQGVEDIIIRNNTLEKSTITVTPDTVTGTVKNVIISGNVVDGKEVCSEGITVGGNYSPSGRVKVSDNEVSIFSSGTGIRLAALDTDYADYYEVLNNRVTCGSPGATAYGIKLDTLTKKATVDGNTCDSWGSGIKEITVGDTTYGNNTFRSCATNYDLAARRWVNLGDTLVQEIYGDTTCPHNLRITGELYISSGAVGYYNDQTSMLDASGIKVLDSAGNAVSFSVNSDTSESSYTKCNRSIQSNLHLDLSMKDATEVAEVRVRMDVPVSTRDLLMRYTAANVDTTTQAICPASWYDATTITIGKPFGLMSRTLATQSTGGLALTNYPSPGAVIGLKSIGYGNYYSYTLTLVDSSTFGNETIEWGDNDVRICYDLGSSTINSILGAVGTARETGLTKKWGHLYLINNGSAVITQGAATLTFGVNFTTIPAYTFAAGNPVDGTCVPFLIQKPNKLRLYMSNNYECQQGA